MKRSLFAKLFMYFCVITVLSLATVSLFIYIQSSRAIDKQSETYIAQVINNTSYQTDLYLQTYERVSTSLLVNNSVKHFVDLSPDNYYQRYSYTNDIISNAFTQTFITYPQINLIYIISYNGQSIIYDSQGYADINEFKPDKQLRILKEQTPDNGSLAILKMSVQGKNSDSTITLARKIRGVSSYQPGGVMAIEVQSKKLENIWKSVELTQKGFFFILDSTGQTIYYPQKEQGTSGRESDFIKAVKNGSGSIFISTVGSEKWMFVSRTSEYSGWRLAMAIPVSELREPISTIRFTALVVGLLTLIAALWLAYRFSRSIIRPIQILKQGMRETEKGNWQQIDLPENENEIGGLVHSYNVMVNRLETMINRVYKAELSQSRQALELQKLENEKNKLEFQSLQLQINPHFLYNTLETINCYAIVKDSDEISEIVEAMAYMLRYSVQTNIDEITLVNELNHVRNYLLILKHRIRRSFELEVDVPPELLLEKMVRLTLQPLVENIFQHAFPDGIEPQHTVIIKAEACEKQFLVIVKDNGAGMNSEKLALLREKLAGSRWLNGEESNNRGGIGLINVHKRIQMVFGENYGVSIESAPGQGTVVTLNMPKL